MTEEIKQTAPVLPWELCIREGGVFYQRLEGGGMAMKFIPMQRTPQGTMLMPPAVEVSFSAEGWERYKREVAADGEKPPVVPVARQMPDLRLAGK